MDRFIQIAVAWGPFGLDLLALDVAGNVWKYIEEGNEVYWQPLLGTRRYQPLGRLPAAAPVTLK